MLISESKFNAYLNKFHETVMGSPYTIVLEIWDSETPVSFEESFVGDSVREHKTSYTFNALYDKNVPQRTREKYGLPSTVDGSIYLSFEQLRQKGITEIDINKTKVIFEGRTQLINHVVYLDHLYGKYIGVQLFVTDILKGG